MDDSFDISTREDSKADTAQSSETNPPKGVAQQSANPLAGQTTVAGGVVTPFTGGQSQPGGTTNLFPYVEYSRSRGSRMEVPLGGHNSEERAWLAEAQRLARLCKDADAYYVAIAYYAYHALYMTRSRT